MPELRLSHGTVAYEVLRRARRTVGVVVRENGCVEVHAPRRASETEIRRVVDEFRPWIEKKRRAALERVRRLDARRFDDGDEVPYLGGTLRLAIDEADDAVADPPSVAGRTLTVAAPSGLSDVSRRAHVRLAVKRWLLARACDVFHRRHVAMSETTGLAARSVVIKDMRTRWGSCGPDGRMNLNWRLVLAPEPVIDYVLVHELMHIEEPNHSRAFWRKVARHCDHWRTSRRWLKVNGEDLEL